MSEQRNDEKPGEPVERLEGEAQELKAERLEEEAEELEAKHPIQVFVNDKYKVALLGKKQTGLSIKESAIAQHVPIQIDFVLSLELGGGKTEIVGDRQPIKVKKGDRFLAIPDDDNS